MLAQEPKVFMKDRPIVVEPTDRWIRTKLTGEYIADSKHALLLIEYGPGLLPTYFFPRQDIRMDLLSESEVQTDSTKKFWDITVDGKVTRHVAWNYLTLPEDRTLLGDYITFTWFKMDHWYEEEEEVFVHARDPHHRVDVTRSSRHVHIEANGVVLADTHSPYLLFETGLPTRYYIPREDVSVELLTPTSLTTACPYKGTAAYWSIEAGNETLKDSVWCYATPIAEAPKIKELMCFFNEKVDITVDGVLQPRPVTPWSD